MRKWTTAILLLFLATVIGVGIWYYIQKDYNPALKELQSESAEQIPEEKIPKEQLPEEQIREDSALDGQLLPDNDWGVILTAEDVTPDGMTLVCTQCGGSPSGELSTGAWYELEKKTGGQWIQAEMYAEVCWEDIAWNIPMSGRVEWDVNWTWIYGSLENGEYRLVKELMDFRQTGDFDTCRSYVYFKIE